MKNIFFCLDLIGSQFFLVNSSLLSYSVLNLPVRSVCHVIIILFDRSVNGGNNLNSTFALF